MVAASEIFQILHFSDMHLFADRVGTLFGIRTGDNLAAALKTAKQVHPEHDLVLISGDLTQDGEPGAFRLAEVLFVELGTPVWAVPGNHDPAETMRQALSGLSIVWKQAVVVGGWHLVFLNSGCPEMVGGCLSEEVVTELDLTLKKHPDLPTLVVLHHPPVNVGTPWLDRIGLQRPEGFLRVLDQHTQVRALLFGHIHQPFEGQRNGVRLLAAPSTYAQFAVGGEKPVLTDDPPAFRWLNLYANGRLETGITRVNPNA